MQICRHCAFFSEPEDETYVAKAIKTVTATCALNLPLYDLLKEMYLLWVLFFLMIYSPGDGDAALTVTEIKEKKMVFRKVYNKRI